MSKGILSLNSYPLCDIMSLDEDVADIQIFLRVTN